MKRLIACILVVILVFGCMSNVFAGAYNGSCENNFYCRYQWNKTTTAKQNITNDNEYAKLNSSGNTGIVTTYRSRIHVGSNYTQQSIRSGLDHAFYTGLTGTCKLQIINLDSGYTLYAAGDFHAG